MNECMSGDVLQTEIHWYGWIAMTFYLCAFVFYMYVRIAHSLDLGPGYIWYGIYLLCVEVLGFTTTIIYGLNLLWNPVIEQFPEDPQSPGRPQVGAFAVWVVGITVFDACKGAMQPSCHHAVF